MTGVIRIKKKDVRKILSLYTIDGLSQKETGQIVLGSEDIQGVSTYAIAQRVLHYFGLNMEYRRDYKHDGLTEDIIDLILDNRTLAFPLAIPTDGKFNAALNFDAEVNKYLSGDSRKWNIICHIKNLSVVAILIVLTYFLVIIKSYDAYEAIAFLIFISIFGINGLIGGVEGEGGKGLENSGIWGIIFAFVLISIIVITLIKMFMYF